MKEIETEANQDMVYKLLKVLYNLKQFLHFWYKRFANFLLQKLALSKINVDHNIFLIKRSLNGLVISTFIDDIKIKTLKEGGII